MPVKPVMILQKVNVGWTFWPKFELSLKKTRNRIFKPLKNNSIRILQLLIKTGRPSLYSLIFLYAFSLPGP